MYLLINASKEAIQTLDRGCGGWLLCKLMQCLFRLTIEGGGVLGGEE
jgi:hypothetical protein